MTRIIACLECATKFIPRRVTQDFCSPQCSIVFNNRAKVRGAELYHVAMFMRARRKEATRVGAFGILCAMISAFLEEDKADRDGRPAYNEKALLRDGHSKRGRERQLKRLTTAGGGTTSIACTAIPAAACTRNDEVSDAAGALP